MRASRCSPVMARYEARLTRSEPVAEEGGGGAAPAAPDLSLLREPAPAGRAVPRRARRARAHASRLSPDRDGHAGRGVAGLARRHRPDRAQPARAASPGPDEPALL